MVLLCIIYSCLDWLLNNHVFAKIEITLFADLCYVQPIFDSLELREVLSASILLCNRQPNRTHPAT